MPIQEIDERCKEILREIDEDLEGLYLRVKDLKYTISEARESILPEIKSIRKKLAEYVV